MCDDAMKPRKRPRSVKVGKQDLQSNDDAFPAPKRRSSDVKGTGFRVDVLPCSPEKPYTLSLKQLRAVIPKHCFKRSSARSFAYLARDLCCVFAIGYCGTCIGVPDALVHRPWLASPVYWSQWAFYWFWQGTFMTGIWVIAHECGHRAFSSKTIVNDTVGLLLHSTLLVPYHSWRISHGKHHTYTGNMHKDEVFVPRFSSDMSPRAHAIGNFWVVRLLRILITLTLGWPLYLWFNISGHQSKGWMNHYIPHKNNELFSKEQRKLVWLSDVALLVCWGVICCFCYSLGVVTVLNYYILPYFVVNCWLVSYTLLHHTHKSLPHYTGDEWNFLRGALATVDRNYSIFNWIHHNIGDTHVVHHVFSTMPHYHATEATEAVKPLLGDYYIMDSTPIHKAFWEAFGECNFVRAANETSKKMRERANSMGGTMRERANSMGESMSAMKESVRSKASDASDHMQSRVLWFHSIVHGKVEVVSRPLGTKGVMWKS